AMSASLTGRLVSLIAVGVCAVVASGCAAGSTNAPTAGATAPAVAPTSAPAAAAPIARPAASPAAAVAQSVAAPTPAPPGNQSPAEAAQLPITQATGRMVIYTTEIAILAQDAQLLELMKRTGTMDELLKVQQQADQVRLQIDRLKGRGTAWERLSSLASIGVTAQAAGQVVEQEYAVALVAVRQTEAQRAGLQSQLKRARTPEEEAG